MFTPARHGLAVLAAAVLVGFGGVPRANAQLDIARRAAIRHPQPAPLDTSTTVFRGVGVVPMDRDTLLRNQTVVVRGGRIVAVGPAARTRVPRGARVIEGRGQVLLPALADLHVHLRYLKGGHENPAMLRMFLASGVTTVLNLLGLPEHLALRDSIARGALLGPDLWTSGFYVNPPFVSTPAQGDSAVRAQREAGYDFVKIHGDLPDSSYRRVMAVARETEMPVVGHAQRQLGIDVSFQERQPVAHVEEYLYAYLFRRTTPIPPDSVRPMLRDVAARTARAGIPVGTTLAVFCGIAGQVQNLDSVLARPEVKHVPAGILREWQPGQNRYTRERYPDPEGMANQCKVLQYLTRMMQEEGVLLVAGTDTPVPATVPGTSLVDELRLLVEAGLTPYQALRTATVHAAQFLGEESEFGRVAPGARADLMLLTGDPRRDVGIVARPQGLMVRGRWFDAAALAALIAPTGAAR